MKKTNSQKGITLIALIITIVVLLILAVVAIRAVTGDGIITKARESANKYSDAQIQESLKLIQQEVKLAKASGNAVSVLDKVQAEEWCTSATGVGDLVVAVAKNGKTYAMNETGKVVSDTSALYTITKNNEIIEYDESFAVASTNSSSEATVTTLVASTDSTLSTVSTTEFTKGLVKYSDGTKYFAGTVDNNYVWFGGFIWRIVDIETSGNIKLVIEQQITEVVAGPKDNSYGSLKDNYIGKWLTKEFLANFSRADDLLTVNYSTPDLTSTESTWNSKVSLLTTEDCLRAGIYEHASYTKYYNNKQYYPYRGLESSYLLTGYSSATMLANIAYYGSHTPERIRMRYLSEDSSSGDQIQQMDLTYASWGIRPVVTIDGAMIINSGDGTKANPYVFEGETVATTVKDMNVGEYVKLANGDTAKVMAKDDTGVKFILTRNLTTRKYFNTTTNIFSTDSEGYTVLTQYFNGTLTTDSSYENKVDITGYLDTNSHSWYVGSYKRADDYETTLETVSDYTGSYAIPRVGEMFASKDKKDDFSETGHSLTLTPVADNKTKVYLLNGYLQTSDGNVNSIRPAFYLKTDLKVTSGNGQYNNPYVLETLS